VRLISESKIVQRRVGLYQSRMSRLLGAMFISAATLALVWGVARLGSATAAYPHAASSQPDISLTPAAYLYRLDPGSGDFITIPLPSNSSPAAVRVVSDSLRQQIWFSEPGLGRVGRVVFTSVLDYALTEFIVGGNPVGLAASETDVWFTLPGQNQVGHLDVSSGAVARYDLPSAQADPADIAIGPSDRVWVTERAVDRLAMVVTSPTVTITEYFLPGSGLMPEGVLPVEDGSIWFATSATGYVWQLVSGTGSYLVAVPMGPNSYPYRLTSDEANRIWVTLKDTNQLAMIVPGSLLYTVFYTIPTANSQPTAIGVDPLGQVYFAEQSVGRIGQLAPISGGVFIEYPLPCPDLTLADLTVAGDGSVWAVAYRTVHQAHLPVVMRDYDAGLSPFAVQMYHYGPLNGWGQAIEAGVRSVRVPAAWAGVEPVNTTPDNYRWAGLDAAIQFASDAGIQLILTIDGNPSWAAASASGPVTNTADLQEFVGAAVARYPHIQYWEFYNEPDHRKAFGLNGDDYAAMLRSIYPVVKAANPNAKVIMGGLALDWFIEDGGPFDSHFLDDVLTHCAGPCFDLANFHYYPWFRPIWEPYGRDILGKATFVSQKLALHGYSRPIVNTETGWPSGSSWGSPELQARYVPKTYIRSLAAGLLAVNWYAWLDSDTSNPGLLGPGLTPRPAYTVYQTLVTQMRFAHFVRAIPAAETGSTYLEGYQFSIPNLGGQKRFDVYWYDCPSLYTVPAGGMPTDCSNVAPLHVNASRVAIIDKMGNKTILNDADDGLADGKVTLPGGVGSSPLYVDYAP